MWPKLIDSEYDYQINGVVLCLGVISGDTIRTESKVEKGDRLNGVRVESCKKQANEYEVNFLPVESSKKFKKGHLAIHHKKMSQLQIIYHDKNTIKKSLTLLDEPYYRLAIRRTTRALNTDVAMAPLDKLFDFSNTLEGHRFWWAVMLGESPELPELSRQELDSEFLKPNVK